MKYQTGNRVTGIINNITDLGIFLTLPDHRHGLIHHNDFDGNWTRVRSQHQVGETLRVVVLHNHKGKLALSLSRVNDPYLIDPQNQFSNLKVQDFSTTLNNTAENAAKEIKQLEHVLSEN